MRCWAGLYVCVRWWINYQFKKNFFSVCDNKNGRSPYPLSHCPAQYNLRSCYLMHRKLIINWQLTYPPVHMYSPAQHLKWCPSLGPWFFFQNTFQVNQTLEQIHSLKEINTFPMSVTSQRCLNYIVLGFLGKWDLKKSRGIENHIQYFITFRICYSAAVDV